MSVTMHDTSKVYHPMLIVLFQFQLDDDTYIHQCYLSLSRLSLSLYIYIYIYVYISNCNDNILGSWFWLVLYIVYIASLYIEYKTLQAMGISFVENTTRAATNIVTTWWRILFCAITGHGEPASVYIQEPAVAPGVLGIHSFAYKQYRSSRA